MDDWKFYVLAGLAGFIIYMLFLIGERVDRAVAMLRKIVKE